MSSPASLSALPRHTLRRFRWNGPHRVAGLLLLLFALQGLWVLVHRTLHEEDFRVAECGRETWERPSPIRGYYTSCGNVRDGILAYRLAGLPLSLARRALGGELSTWEMVHQTSAVPLLVGAPFLLAGLLLGTCLWWVARRLFGDHAGTFALALYCALPPVVRAATRPNSEILAALGVFALVYTGMGVAHALSGPRRKWWPRLVLMAAILGATAASHLLAMLLGLLLATALLLYLAQERRALVPTLGLGWLAGAALCVLAAYGFRVGAAAAVLGGGAARFGFSPEAPRAFLQDVSSRPFALLLAAALALWATVRRSRYFGHTAPLLVGLLLAFLNTTEVRSEPLLWALPFLLLYMAGVFADAWESRLGRVFAGVAVAGVAAQVVLALRALPLLAR